MDVRRDVGAIHAGGGKAVVGQVWDVAGQPRHIPTTGQLRAKESEGSSVASPIPILDTVSVKFPPLGFLSTGIVVAQHTNYNHNFSYLKCDPN